MTNKIFMSLLFVTAVLFAVSCNNDADDVRDEAVQEVSGQGQDASNTFTTQAPAEEPARQQAEQVPAGPTTTLEFEETTFDFGTVKQGEKVTHIFKFRNTGDEPLIISNAKATCGCTVPRWPKEPIAPGEGGEIEVAFDTKGKSNKQNKKITITANTNPPQSFVYLKGVIEAPPKSAEQPAVNQ